MQVKVKTEITKPEPSIFVYLEETAHGVTVSGEDESGNRTWLLHLVIENDKLSFKRANHFNKFNYVPVNFTSKPYSNVSKISESVE